MSGGLTLFWKASYNIQVLYYDKRIIDVQVNLGVLKFFISFVYGDHVRYLWQIVWDSLISIGAKRDEP